jgi:hypothetical protein
MFYGFGLNAGVARIYFTSNGGANWNIGNLGVSGSFISGYAMSDNKLPEQQTVVLTGHQLQQGQTFQDTATANGLKAQTHVTFLLTPARLVVSEKALTEV